MPGPHIKPASCTLGLRGQRWIHTQGPRVLTQSQDLPLSMPMAIQVMDGRGPWLIHMAVSSDSQAVAHAACLWPSSWALEFCGRTRQHLVLV